MGGNSRAEVDVHQSRLALVRMDVLQFKVSRLNFTSRIVNLVTVHFAIQHVVDARDLCTPIECLWP